MDLTDIFRNFELSYKTYKMGQNHRTLQNVLSIYWNYTIISNNTNGWGSQQCTKCTKYNPSTGCFKNEPIKNRFITKSNGLKNDVYIIRKRIDYSFFICGVPLFIVRYKLRPWQDLTYHAQKRSCTKVGKGNSTLGVMNQIRRVKGSVLTFIVRSPSFADYCNKTFQKTLHQRPPSSWAMRQWYLPKGSEHWVCQKTKGKRMEEHSGPVSIIINC